MRWTFIADGKGAHACATTWFHPQYSYDEWLAREKGFDTAEGIRTKKSVLECAIKGRFIRSDGINSIFVCQPLSAGVS